MVLWQCIMEPTINIQILRRQSMFQHTSCQLTWLKHRQVLGMALFFTKEMVISIPFVCRLPMLTVVTRLQKDGNIIAVRRESWHFLAIARKFDLEKTVCLLTGGFFYGRIIEARCNVLLLNIKSMHSE